MLKPLIKVIVLLLLFSPSTTRGQSIENIESSLDSIFQSTDHIEICRLLGMVRWRTDLVKNIPCIPPIDPVRLDRITPSSNYGYRVHPITNVSHLHSGIDLPPHTSNDTIYAPGNGIIDTIGFERKIGVYIRIKHKYNYVSIFGHLDAVLCSPGQTITIGCPIGIMGTTGASTGKHLHYTIKHKDKNISPLPYCYLLMEIMNRVFKSDQKE